MKKFYAFAAAAMMAVAANAQTLYVCGSGEGLDWKPETPLELEKTGDNYTLEVANLVEFKISTAFGDWASFNEAALTCDYGKEAGVTKELVAGDSNISAPWKGDYTIEIAGDLSTIKLTTTTPPPSGPTPLFLRGAMNGWGAPEEWQLQPQNDANTIYKLVFSDDMVIAAGDEFKVADADWGSMNYGAGEDGSVYDEVEAEMFNKSNTNFTATEEFTGVAWVNLDLDGKIFLILSNDKDFNPEWDDTNSVKSIASDNNVAAKYFNLQGVQVANPENGLYIVVKGDKATKVLVK